MLDNSDVYLEVSTRIF